MRCVSLLLALTLLSACQADDARTQLRKGSLASGSSEAKQAVDSEFQEVLTQLAGTVSREALVESLYKAQLNLSHAIAASEDEAEEVGRCLIYSSQPLKDGSRNPGFKFNSLHNVAYTDADKTAGNCEGLARQYFSQEADRDQLIVTFFSYTF